MTTQEAEATPLEIDRADIGVLELGDFEVPYVDLEFAPFVHTHVSVNGVEYAYERSFPVKGHSAVMPQAVSELLAAGKRVLIVERNERYIVYVA